jgi:UDP-2,3-diacylglucosamine pyrophosphatase LpxH
MNDHTDPGQLLHFKTIILSDLHLGSPYAQVEKLLEFLRHTSSETLILNGDIVDGWSLARKGGWSHRATRCIRHIMRKAKDEGTRVVYVRGNHDDFLDKILPFTLTNIEIVKELTYPTRKGTYLITHGDGFDSVTQNHRWLAVVGDIAYQIMMALNSAYQKNRKRFGLPDFSISKWAKAKVKGAVAFIDEYETQLREFAKARDCYGIICGHIHTAADKIEEGFHYLNSGDWVESNTAIVEHLEGGFEVVDFDTFQKWQNMASEGCIPVANRHDDRREPDLDVKAAR